MPVLSVNSCQENSLQRSNNNKNDSSNESCGHQVKLLHPEKTSPTMEDTRIALSSPNNSNIRCQEEMIECAGCCRPIFDRFYLFAVDKKWHISCLKCFACDNVLDSQASCYTREGKIFCKQDFYK